MSFLFKICLLTLIFGNSAVSEPVNDLKLSEEQIAKIRNADPMTKLKSDIPQPKQDDPSLKKVPAETGLIDLTFNGSYTILMKSSVIRIPKALEARIGSVEGTTHKPLRDFLVQNRGWITTHEITIEQASGEKPLSETALKMISTSSNIIIATLEGNPISYKPYQKP